MINVPIDRIVPLTDARDNFSKIVADIESQDDGMYVLTKGGKPSIALINISYLARLINEQGKATPATQSQTIPPKPAVQPRPESKPPVKSFEVKSTQNPSNVPAMPSFDAKLPPVNQPKPEPPKNPSVTSNIAANAGIDPSWMNGGVSTSPTNPSMAPKQNNPIPTTPATPAPSGNINSNTTTSSPSSTPPANSPSTNSGNQPTTPPSTSPTPPVESKPPTMPKPVNPWPILPTREVKPTNTDSSSTAINQIAPSSAPSSSPNSSTQTPASSTTSNSPIAPTTPNQPADQEKPAQTTSSASVTLNPPVVPAATKSDDLPLPPITRKPDLPPPPANDVAIPFDEPPKIDSEPGDTASATSSAQPPVNSPTEPTVQTATTPTPAAPPAPKPTVQDLEI